LLANLNGLIVYVYRFIREVGNPVMEAKTWSLNSAFLDSNGRVKRNIHAISKPFELDLRLSKLSACIYRAKCYPSIAYFNTSTLTKYGIL
jgi:hypothetical protein